MRAVGTYFLNGFDLINDLRIHVLANYFLTASWFLYALGASPRNAVQYALLVACMAGFAYLLNRYTDYHYDVVVDNVDAKVSRTTYLILSLMFLTFDLYLVYSYRDMASPLVIAILVLTGILFALLYSVRTFFTYPIKHYLIYKNIFAVGAKYFVAAAGVFLFCGVSLRTFFIAGISLASIHLIYEILWDVRDMKADAIGKVATIPRAIGKNKTILLLVLVWLASFSSLLFIGTYSSRFFIKYALVLFFILSIAWTENVRWFHIMIYAHFVVNLIFVNHEVITYLESTTM